MRESATSDDKTVQFENHSTSASAAAGSSLETAAADVDKPEGKRNGDGGDCCDAKPKKRRRTWELWSVSAKHAFFEALNECGKDFDKIQAYFHNTLKNKYKNSKNQKLQAEEYFKNKDQIRHFYYRTWHKISAFIKFEIDLNKSTKELFGLINYGEIWRKVGGTLDDRMGAKLNELVQKGTTTLKHKGKTYRFKTPLCKALKKLHTKGSELVGKQKGGPKQEPAKVTIILKPRDTKDWCRTHELAQNPHVKVSLGFQRRLSSLISCLTSKWRHRQTKLLESLAAKEESNSGGSPKASKKGGSEEELVLFPCADAKLTFPVITVAPVLTSSLISLQSLKPDKKQNKVKVKLKLGETLVRETNGNRNSLPNSQLPTQTQECDKLCDQGQVSQDEGGEDYLDDSEGESSRSPVPPPDKEWEMEVENEDEEEEDLPEEKDVVEVDLSDTKDTKAGEQAKTNYSSLRDFNPAFGWSLGSCGSTTVGELFYLLAEEGATQFRLEYTWRTIKNEAPALANEEQRKASTEVDTKPSVCRNILQKLVRLSTCKGLKVGRGRQNSLTSTNVTSPGSNHSARPGGGGGAGGRASKQAASLSPAVRNLLSPASPVTSRVSPIASRGIVKQLALSTDPKKPDKPGSPLAVPLEPEVPEFRKPLAPAPPVLASNLQAQLGHYFPKFSNRPGRGRQNRRNQVVGRHILQPIQPKKPAATAPPQFQNLVLPGGGVASSAISLGSGLPTSAAVVASSNPIIIEAPLLLQASNSFQPSGGGGGVLPPNTVVIQQSVGAPSPPSSQSDPSSNVIASSLLATPMSPIRQVPSSADMATALAATSIAPRSPPQICIPSPAPSPAPHQCPSPTPSFSALMDISFSSVTAPSTPTKQDNFLGLDENSLLHTPPRRPSPSPTSPSRCLSDSTDISLNSWALNFESPSKHSSISVLQHNEDSQSSVISTNSELDRQVSAMMNDNSMDFTSKFRALANHVTSGDQELSQS